MRKKTSLSQLQQQQKRQQHLQQQQKRQQHLQKQKRQQHLQKQQRRQQHLQQQQFFSKHDPEWAWSQYKPDANNPWDIRKAGHFFRRTMFGTNWKQLSDAVDKGPGRVLSNLFKPDADVASFQAACDTYEDNSSGGDNPDALRAWWLYRIMRTPDPLLENLTLFWHNFVGISHHSVKSSRLISHYIRTLRKHALGKAGDLVQAICHDPALFMQCDASVNRKLAPNHYLAGRLLKTFGVSDVTKNDVRDTARAFTGWFVLRNRLRFIDREHDAGSKTIFGRTGNWTSRDAVRIILQQPGVAETIVRKLYRWFISEQVEPEVTLLEPLVTRFRKDYHLKELVKTMLSSNLFFSLMAYRQRVKSPLEFAMGIIRGLEGSVATLELGKVLAELGQDLYAPPTMEGWAGGTHWINSSSLIGRQHLACELLRDKKKFGTPLDPSDVSKKNGHGAGKGAQRFLLRLFFQDDMDEKTRRSLLNGFYKGSDGVDALRIFFTGLTMLPEFHLA